jgi:2-methylisocitrate lyase-like PEP mutase family enzyme
METVMENRGASASATFRDLHAPGRFLILPNAWDAASAALMAACGADAVGTTSAGLSWSRGYPDGNTLPIRIVHAAVSEIVRALPVPLTVDLEAGYTSEPGAVGELAAAVAGAGAVGINLEDGTNPPELLCAKIGAVKRAASLAGVDLFVNARTDVYLFRLVPADEALAATLERARLYREAGCDGLFVPGLAAPHEIRAIASGIGGLPLNVMAVPGLAAAGELRSLGARRLSAGAGLAAAALGRARRLTRDFLRDGRYEPLGEEAVGFAEMNALFPAPRS